MLATPVILRYPDRLSLHHLIPLTLPSSYNHMALPHALSKGTDTGRTCRWRGAMTSTNPPEALQLLKEPWGGPAMTSTIMSSLLTHIHPPGMSALPQRVHYLVGSKPCSMRLILDFKPSSPEQKTSTIGDSWLTSSDTAAQQNESAPSQTLERTLK